MPRPSASIFDLDTRPWLRYIGPTIVFGLFTLLETTVPTSLYPAIYTLKISLVTCSLVVMSAALRDIRPSRAVVLPAVGLGLIVCVLWILIDRWLPYPHLGSRVGFDPFAVIGNPLLAGAFLAVRFFGLVLVVPVMEELLLRSYLIRFVTDPDFLSVGPGDYSRAAFWTVACFSAVTHPEWVSAIVASVAYTLLLKRTRSLFACVVAHGVTNGALGVYIIATREWQYW